MATGYSLHIGLNAVDPAHYAGWDGALLGCEPDAIAMEEICASRHFATDKLITEKATRKALLDRLGSYAGKLAAGDTLIVSYSGHGGQLPDRNSDEPDALDETWCLFDGELLDDELYSMWARFKAGVRIAVFSDSCHSGTVLRNTMLSASLRWDGTVSSSANSLRFRAMPPEIMQRTYLRNKASYDELLKQPAPPATPDCTVVLVSGCQDNQLSMDGPFNGAFTGTLLAVWASGRFGGGYPEFTKEIRSRLPSTQSPNFMLVGASNDDFMNTKVFSI